jgi:SAM-dependent methyltransferase
VSTEQWDEQYKAGQGRYWPNEELVRFLGRTYGPVTEQGGSGLYAAEIGCGAGGNLLALLSWGFETYGYDISEEALREARWWLDGWGAARLLLNRGVILEQYAAPEPLWSGNSVPVVIECNGLDLIIDIQTIQHLNEKDHQAMYLEIARVLKPGGRFFSVHWAGTQKNAAKIFPDHPELEAYDLRHGWMLKDSGLKRLYEEHILKTYNQSADEGIWTVIEAMKR